jgi:hypothetical protein
MLDLRLQVKEQFFVEGILLQASFKRTTSEIAVDGRSQ